MRILFTRFPLESAYGGAEIQTISLMKGLMERGHAVAFAGSCPVLLELCRKEHIPVAEVHLGPPPVSKSAAVSFAWRKRRMEQTLHGVLAQFPDLEVICMLSLTEKLLLTETAAKRGVRTIWIEHDRIGRWLEQNPWLPLLLEQSRYAITVPVSHLSATIYERLGWKKETIKPIPNGIDETRLHIADFHKHVRDTKKFHLLCIARLSHEKGVDILIDALAGTPDTIHLEIVGTGTEEDKLRSTVKRLNLGDRVTFSPNEKDIRTVYSRADALVLPSRQHDPFGLVAAEAMILGLPVIVTDACGIADYVEDGKDGIIAQANSVSALTQAMQTLSTLSTLDQLATHGQKTAQEKFSMKRMVTEYEDVFTVPVPLS